MHQKKCPDRRLHPALIYSPIKPILSLFAISSTNTSPTQIIALSLFTCLLFSLSPCITRLLLHYLYSFSEHKDTIIMHNNKQTDKLYL